MPFERSKQKSVCSISAVRNAPQPLPVSFADRDEERFLFHYACTSVDRIKQVVSVLYAAQELGDFKQKDAFCAQRLRNLKRMFMSILHSL